MDCSSSGWLRPGVTHVQRELGMWPGIFPPLLRSLRVIWHDSRGTGLSERDPIRLLDRLYGTHARTSFI